MENNNHKSKNSREIWENINISLYNIIVMVSKSRILMLVLMIFLLIIGLILLIAGMATIKTNFDSGVIAISFGLFYTIVSIITFIKWMK